MNKEIKKNRETLIRHLFAQEDKGFTSMYIPVDSKSPRCLCAKGILMSVFGEEERNPSRRWWEKIEVPREISTKLGMSRKEWRNAECVFEGFTGFLQEGSSTMEYARLPGNRYHKTAQYLQSLPNWPRVL